MIKNNEMILKWTEIVWENAEKEEWKFRLRGPSNLVVTWFFSFLLSAFTSIAIYLKESFSNINTIYWEND